MIASRLLLVAVLSLCAAAANPEPRNDSYARGRKGAVVSAEPQASAIGLAVLRNGGNAVDAAAAVFLALAVTHPQAGNLGGGGFMVVRMADGRTAAIDFREVGPRLAHRDMYLEEDGSVHPEKSLWGALAVGVPGSPAGVVKALELFGTKPLKQLAAPAIDLAKNGIDVTHFLSRSLKAKTKILTRFPSTAEIFYPGGKALALDSKLVQKDLAATLERFAEAGFDGFYKGETADLLAKSMRKTGGIITAEDLASYRPKVREVLRGTYRGYEVLTMPPASSGGVAVLQMLNILEPYDLRSMGYGSAQSIHLMTEAMKRAYADRARWLGDSDHYKVPLEGLISKRYADQLRKTMRSDRATEVGHGLPPGADEGDNTTHFSVVDAAGNAVSCTTTLNSTFGSGLVAAGTGFFLNNEMDDFSAKPGVPNQFGLIGGEANAIKAGKRMLSSMTPTIVLKGGKVRYVIGSPGGGRIINSVFQVILNTVDHGMPVVDAVAVPRVHHQWRPDHLYWERNALNPDSRRLLEKMGHTFAPRARGIGRCQVIEITPKGERIAVSDPRSGGTAVAY